MIKILFMGLQPKSKASISSNKFFKQTRLTTDVNLLTLLLVQLIISEIGEPWG